MWIAPGPVFKGSLGGAEVLLALADVGAVTMLLPARPLRGPWGQRSGAGALCPGQPRGPAVDWGFAAGLDLQGLPAAGFGQCEHLPWAWSCGEAGGGEKDRRGQT